MLPSRGRDLKRRLVGLTLDGSDKGNLDLILDHDHLTWHLFQAKAHLESLEAALISRYTSPQNSEVVGVALAGNASEFDPEQVLDRFDRFAAGEESELMKFLYYEPRVFGGIVFYWEEVGLRKRTAWQRLTEAVVPVRRYPVNWSPTLFRQALAYNIDPNIPLEPNLDPREIRFRVLFGRVNLFLTGVSFFAVALFAEFVLRPRGVHEVIQLWLSFCVPVICYLVGKYAGIWQLCKLRDSNPDNCRMLMFEQSQFRRFRFPLRLLKWNPILALSALGIVTAWATMAGR